MVSILAAFILGVVVSVVVNILTALVSREKALRLLPWMILYIALHGTYVLVQTDPIRGFFMAQAKQFGGWQSYLVVMLAAAVAAALFWRSTHFAVAALDKATSHAVSPQPQHPVGNPVGNLKQRTLDVADGAIAILCGRGWYRDANPLCTDLKARGKAYDIFPPGMIPPLGTPESNRKAMTAGAYFYWKYERDLKRVHEELAREHLVDNRLERFFEFYPDARTAIQQHGGISPNEVTEVALTLRELAAKLP